MVSSFTGILVLGPFAPSGRLRAPASGCTQLLNSINAVCNAALNTQLRPCQLSQPLQSPPILIVKCQHRPILKRRIDQAPCVMGP